MWLIATCLQALQGLGVDRLLLRLSSHTRELVSIITPTQWYWEAVVYITMNTSYVCNGSAIKTLYLSDSPMTWSLSLWRLTGNSWCLCCLVLAGWPQILPEPPVSNMSDFHSHFSLTTTYQARWSHTPVDAFVLDGCSSVNMRMDLYLAAFNNSFGFPSKANGFVSHTSNIMVLLALNHHIPGVQRPSWLCLDTGDAGLYVAMCNTNTVPCTSWLYHSIPLSSIPSRYLDSIPCTNMELLSISKTSCDVQQEVT